MKLTMTRSLISASLLGCGLMAQGAMAQEATEGAADTGIKINAELRGAFTMSEDKLAETDRNGSNPERAKISFTGSPFSNLDYRLRLDLINMNNTAADATSPVEYMNVTWWINQDMGILFGQNKVAQGGWEQANFNLVQAYGKDFLNNHFASYKSMAALVYKFMGTVQLQAFNDDSDGNTWNTGTHPTFALQWKGEAMGGMLKPMFEYLSYDNNHSNVMSVGTGFHMNEISGSAGLVMDSMNAKGADSAGEAEDNETKQMIYHLEVAYNAAGFEPYFYYAASSVDAYVPEGADAVTADGTSMSFGLRVKTDKAITPFLAYNAVKATTTAGSADAVDVVDATQLKFGFYTKF